MELPSFLQIEPVGQCNLRCEMCAIPFREDGPPYGPPAFLDFDTFRNVLDQFPALKELQLQGLGEPMMHPRFFDMVALAVSRGVKVSTNSNLTLLSDRRAELCVTSGLAELHISIDGATPETYEKIRVRSHFDRVLANVERLAEARRRHGSATPWLRMVVVAMRQNLHEFPDLVRLARRLSIDTVFVQHLCHEFAEEGLPAKYRPLRAFVEDQTLLEEDQDRVEHVFAEARRTAEALGVDLRLPSTRPRPHPPGTPGAVRCDWPYRGTYLSYDGMVMPCCMVSTPDRINFGSVKDQPLHAIWNGEAYESFRDRLDSESPPGVCRSCSIYRGTF